MNKRKANRKNKMGGWGKGVTRQNVRYYEERRKKMPIRLTVATPDFGSGD